MFSDYDIDKIFDMFDKQIEILSQLINNIESKMLAQENILKSLMTDVKFPSGIIHNVNNLNNQIHSLSNFVEESSDVINQQIDCLFEMETSTKSTVAEHKNQIDSINDSLFQLTNKILTLNKKAQISADFMKATANVLSDISSRISEIENKINDTQTAKL